ncbi:alpha/beta fold hydrolase [Dyella flagellata]|uniref:AB hydrolase-1 domain-containing protein n=1 Tax=Dyella flagellata TaxID=1867833 RepID=A0ABQ5XEM4_9GAMM|nr:alpha/beta hydrolase [Dyella flagellata]GLQ89977.1 hypothetical protein GCM10007898_35520 [Dyella flagellata]
MTGAWVDSFLTRLAAKRPISLRRELSPFRYIETAVGTVRAYDSGSTLPCVVMVPDGPNVIEHYAGLISLLSERLRVVCFDMPGFGYSLPQASYAHSLDQGARAVLGVLDDLGIERATLAFSCANGFYALRAAQLAPGRVANLVLSQTPSLSAMHAWSDRTIPKPLRVPVLGQITAWLFRQMTAAKWYGMSLPRTTDPQLFRERALTALSNGACFCLASVVQGLAREKCDDLHGIKAPCTMIWGEQDYSHRLTDPCSLHEVLSHAEIVRFEDCGHFPDLEQPGRFAELLIEQVFRYA